MKIFRSLAILALLLLILLGVIGLIYTRDSGTAVPTKTAGPHKPPVDEAPSQTAREMAKLATTWDQQRYAQQALKIANHEVDLAFADALRDASEHPPQLTELGRQLYAKMNQAEALVNAGQERTDQIKKELATAKGSRHDTLQQQLDIAQAKLALDQDELDDAKGNLTRSGADPLSRIQRQFNRRQALQQAEANRAPATPAAQPTPPATNLIGQFSALRALRGKIASLAQAQTAADHKATDLTQAHNALEKEVGSEQADQQAITEQATTQLNSGSPTADSPEGDVAAALATLHVVAVDQKTLADLDRRVQDMQELRDAYGNWIVLLQTNQRVLLHGIIKSSLWIVLIVLTIYLATILVDRFVVDPNPELTRFRTLRTVLRFAIQAIGVLLILFVVFGTPNQLSTIIGLATAGLTVALKDFIISFLGWFALMGRNGIRVGDWVEINGVVGEVVEITLMRTVLLETGNWTDTGHPTGRKVAFMNGFAIEGHFFNFSTAGQWLWDDLEIMVPSADDPYPVIEAIQKLVTKETEAQAAQAQKEWQHTTSRYRVRAVSAAPAVNLRPSGAGVELHIRYITRANERYATRAHLYQALVELLHRRGVHAAPASVKG